MTDTFTGEQRSRLMGRIGQRNTKPEVVVRKYLHARGFRFRAHKKELPGTPDIWLKKYNAAIFVHGCYWHRHNGCKYSSIPDDNREKWEAKFAANVARDERNLTILAVEGIRVLVVWDCSLRTKLSRECWLPKIAEWLATSSDYLEIPYDQ